MHVFKDAPNFDQFRTFKLASWSQVKKNNWVSSLVDGYIPDKPLMFIIKFSASSCMIVFSFAGLPKKEDSKSNLSGKHDDRDFIIFSNTVKNVLFYKLKAKNKSNPEPEDQYLVVNQLGSYESVLFMHEKIPKISIPSNNVDASMADLYPIKPVSPADQLAYVFPVGLTPTEMEVYLLLDKSKRNINYGYSLAINEMSQKGNDFT